MDMQKQFFWMGLGLLMASSILLTGQNVEQDNTYKKWYIGSSLLVLGNFIPDDPNPPEYVQLNLGYRLTPKDVMSIRFKRSIYSWPLGIPFGPDFDGPGLGYPGHARIIAPQIGYQHFWWKGVYTSVTALNAFEKYLDNNDRKLGNGFTLYLDFYMGYQFKFLKKRFFFEPAIGCSYWPIITNVPESFPQVESKWTN